jgi:hypothetical protein
MVGYHNIKSADYRGFCNKARGMSFRKETESLFIKEIDDFNEGFDEMPQCEVS